eukprot:3941471-Rhodomonas_salina.1
MVLSPTVPATITTCNPHTNIQLTAYYPYSNCKAYHIPLAPAVATAWGHYVTNCAHQDTDLGSAYKYWYT